MAQLFAEEVELSSTPPLPRSRLLKKELGKASRCLRLPEGKENFLWEGSALTGAWALESFYTASLAPSMMPQWLTKVHPPLHYTWVHSREGLTASGLQNWKSTTGEQKVPEEGEGRGRNLGASAMACFSRTTGSQMYYVPGEFI